MASGVRVRFAPSPTGFLHLGGLRTALFNFLLARQSGPGGRFVLRIEDTDQARIVPGAVEQIAHALRWAGIPHDEGPGVGGPVGPYVQSARLPLYHTHAHKLLEAGHAYCCFCSAEELNGRRVLGKYDRRCLSLPRAEVDARLRAGELHTIRLRVPAGKTALHDLVYGRIQFDNQLVDDQILLKSDGFPTYHLANVVDDHAMGITHVVRGEEWISSTPKHLMLYSAFGWSPPQFAHLPLLLGEDKLKLSKRNNDANVGAYMEDYLPEALVNFVAFLGWSPEHPREVFTLDELVKEFSIKRVHKAGAVVLRHKLDWFNRAHIVHMADTAEGMAALIARVRPLFVKLAGAGDRPWLRGEPTAWRWQDDAYLARVIDASKDRMTLLREIPTLFAYFFEQLDWRSDAAQSMRRGLADNSDAALAAAADAVWPALEALTAPGDRWRAGDGVDKQLQQAAVAAGVAVGLKYKDALMVTRYMVTATSVGPGVGKIMEVLGPTETLARLARFRQGAQAGKT